MLGAVVVRASSYVKPRGMKRTMTMLSLFPYARNCSDQNLIINGELYGCYTSYLDFFHYYFGDHRYVLFNCYTCRLYSIVKHYLITCTCQLHVGVLTLDHQ